MKSKIFIRHVLLNKRTGFGHLNHLHYMIEFLGYFRFGLSIGALMKVNNNNLAANIKFSKHLHKRLIMLMESYFGLNKKYVLDPFIDSKNAKLPEFTFKKRLYN